MRKSRYLYLTAFVSGFVSLALELSAGRLLAPAFGTTEIVWSAIIGLILLYLSIGYVIGGKWADKSPDSSTLYTILVGAGCAIAIIPLASRPMLNLAIEGMRLLNLGQLAGPFITILALFVVPVTLLATVTPFVIRLSLPDVKHSGDAVGRIYALSTAGSFIGAFLPNLLLIPNLGTWRTFVILSVICSLAGLGGLWQVNRQRFWILAIAVPMVILVYFLKPESIITSKRLVYEDESAYNYIQVIEDSSLRRYLLLNEGQGIHSIYTSPELRASDPFASLTGGPWDYFLIAPFFNTAPFPQSNVENMLVIGLAAGTTSTQFTDFYGPLPIDGVEIDPAIVEAGVNYFDMVQPNLTVHVTDGRTYLTTTEQQYSLIVIDAYRLPYIPWHLTTVEFFSQIHSHLDEYGSLAINVGLTPYDSRLVDAMANTLYAVFPSVYVIEIENSLNAVVVATVQFTDQENLERNLPVILDQRLLKIAETALPNVRLPGTSALVFTDDRAPVEQISHTLALGYMLRRD